MGSPENFSFNQASAEKQEAELSPAKESWYQKNKKKLMVAMSMIVGLGAVDQALEAKADLASNDLNAKESTTRLETMDDIQKTYAQETEQALADKVEQANNQQ